MAELATAEWLQALMEKLNTDQQYAQIARKWEGDMVFKVEADEILTESITYYMDLWHGKCRDAYILPESEEKEAALEMKATYSNVAKLLKGEFEVIQALLTRKISVRGNMSLLMRNVPTVLDFVRCCREVTSSYL